MNLSRIYAPASFWKSNHNQLPIEHAKHPPSFHHTTKSANLLDKFLISAWVEKSSFPFFLFAFNKFEVLLFSSAPGVIAHFLEFHFRLVIT